MTFCGVVLCIVSLTFALSSSADHYAIILDAGSSGTKLKIYTWTNPHQPTRDSNYDVRQRVHDINLHTDLKFPPGIGTKVDSISEINTYLTPLIETAKHRIPANRHASTTIRFLATAGLRIYANDVTDTLLDAVETFLTNTSHNPFLIPVRNSVRVISGEEEAVYAWVAANYLNGYFTPHRSVVEPVGVLEMGGGSTQIAFLPDHSVYANMFPVYITGLRYHLYAHSYLLYGQNYILQRINNYLLEQSSVENPCMLIGDEATVTHLDKSVHITGSGNVTKCLDILQLFLHTADDKWCSPKPCAIGRTYQPSVRNTVFYAISAFQYAPKYLQAISDIGRLEVDLLRHNARVHCHKTLEEVVAEGLPEDYASPYCVMGLYIPSLLDTYGFSDNDTIYVKTEIDGVKIDWALGAMLTFMEEINIDICDNSNTVTRASFYLHVSCAILMLFVFIHGVV